MQLNNYFKTLGAAVALSATLAHAGLVNPGFEHGTLLGWTSSLSGGSADVVTTISSDYLTPATYTAPEGQFFLAIGAGDEDVWQTVSQTMELVQNELVKGYAAFDWGDYIPDLSNPDAFKDGAKVEILDALGAVISTPFYMDGSLICTAAACPPGVAPSGDNGPWTPWSFKASLAGTYTVVYAARNTGDSGGPNQTKGLFDVPEPTSLALAGLALLAGVGARRRKQ